MHGWPGPQRPEPAAQPGIRFPWSQPHTFGPGAVSGPRPRPPFRAGPWADSTALGAAGGGPAAAEAEANEAVEVGVEEEVVDGVGGREVEEEGDDLDPWGAPWRPTPAAV